jgi:hypothetical protein
VSFGGCEDNLEEFITRMVGRGYEIIAFYPADDPWEDIMKYKNIEKNDFNHIAYQALNFEHTNIRFFNKETKSIQTISVMMTGDPYCDVVPINDWSFQRGKTDVVDEIFSELREEIMGDEA